MISKSASGGRWALALACGALLGLAVAGDATAERRSYPMSCRGGGEMRIAFRNYPDFRVGVFVRFRKSTHDEGWWHLEPGYCTWLDRRINADEPREMRWFIEPGQFGVECTESRGCSLVQAPGDSFAMARAVSQGDEYFEVQVYNDTDLDGRSFFRVTGLADMRNQRDPLP